MVSFGNIQPERADILSAEHYVERETWTISAEPITIQVAVYEVSSYLSAKVLDWGQNYKTDPLTYFWFCLLLPIYLPLRTMLSLPFAALAASGLGVASHLGFFMHGEHGLHGIHILRAAILLPSLTYIYLINYSDFTHLHTILFTTTIFWSYAISVWCSMFIYRGFFHPLRNFPGPSGAKYTKIWHSFAAADFKWYKTVNKLHEQYGDFVRTGPNELSIADPTSIELIHGFRSRCTKSPWYDIGKPHVSLQLHRDRPTHDKRRRIAWERAFTAKALRAYDPTITLHADELVSGIKTHAGKAVNVSKWFNYFTADTISALGFGEPFHMLKDGKDHWTVTLLQEGSSHLATLGPLPWLLSILNHFPMLQRANLRAAKWSIGQVEKRRDRKVADGVDIMHWLLNPLEPMSTDPKMELEWLQGDARLAIIAGTDTTTAALSYLFLELCRNPAITQSIRSELLTRKLDQEFSLSELQKCEYLNAVIDETLRLHPPVPDGVYRLTPPEGLQIGETFVPGNVTVINPIYTVQRSASSFVDPTSFLPERWTTQPELILNRKAFAPFVIGPYGCVGKQLALGEIRAVVAKLVMGFEVGFAEGEDGRRIEEDTKDYFVLGLGDLELCFKERANEADK